MNHQDLLVTHERLSLLISLLFVILIFVACIKVLNNKVPYEYRY